MKSPRTALIEGAIAPTLFFFTLPILASNVLQSLNGSVNSIWVGHYLGEAALTATSNANTILFFLLTLVFGVGMAATILVGQSVGARDVAQAKRVVGTSATFFVVGSLIIAALGGVATQPLLAVMQTPPDAMPYATAYLRIIFAAIPFLFAYTFLMMVLRGAGDSKTPFFFLVLSVLLDIALNPLLIFGAGPIPRLGIAGSALATLIAQVVSLASLLVHLYRARHFLWLHGAEWRLLRPDPRLLRALIVKGLPMGLQMIVLSGASIAVISLVNRFGSQTTAAYGAALQLWNYIMMPALAVGMAASSMAAQNVGARRWDRVRRTAVTGVLFNVLMTGALVVILYLFNRAALSLFLPDGSDALALAQHINAIVVWSFVLFGISMVLGGVVRSTGAAVPPLIVLFVSLWLIRLPLAVALMGPWQADGIWWSFPVGAGVSAVLMWLYYRYGGWRRAHMLAPARAPNPAD
ncbi:MAG TPA: MATE family efflux transporter [Casimicrobiaceae bacterium]|jgi:putative MATE family efflux protein|nr:MATE family efflux transporter [Casimicrobiaceae bacterium]